MVDTDIALSITTFVLGFLADIMGIVVGLGVAGLVIMLLVRLYR